MTPLTPQSPLLLSGDDGRSNADRSADPKYRPENATPASLMEQLNAAWCEMRLFGRAVADRDRQIHGLHESIRQRDKAIAARDLRLRLSNRFWPLIYAAIGGASAKAAELGLPALWNYAARHGIK